MVIRHLWLKDWQRIDDVDAFDVLGAPTQSRLRRYGLWWPAPLYCHAPLVELAAGDGAIIVGQGGGEVMGFQCVTRAAYVLLKEEGLIPCE